MSKRLFVLAMMVGLAIDCDLVAAQDQPPPPTAAPAAPSAPAPQPMAADPAYPPAAYAPAPEYPRRGRMRRGRDRYQDDYRVERRPRRSRGMMIAGIALLAAGYVPPAMIGVAVGTEKRSECDCRDALRLLIPIVGPLTLWKPDRDLNVFFDGLMLIDSLIQTTGLVLTIFGAIRYSESAQDDEYYGKLRLHEPKPRLTFSALPLPGGMYGGLRLQL